MKANEMMSFISLKEQQLSVKISKEINVTIKEICEKTGLDINSIIIVLLDTTSMSNEEKIYTMHKVNINVSLPNKYPYC
jgi:hypothetical protein